MTTIRNSLRSTSRSPLRGTLEGKFNLSSVFSLEAPNNVSFAVAAQPFNATGASIADSTSTETYDNLLLAFDLDRSFFHWDGADKSIGDATDNLDGSYGFTISDIDITGKSWFVEYDNNGIFETDENVFSLGNSTGANDRFEAGTGQKKALQVYDNGSASYALYDFANTAGEQGDFGRLRLGGSYESGQPKIIQAQYIGSAPTNNNAVSVTGFDEVGIGFRRWDNGKLFEGTFHKAYMFSTTKTEDELYDLMKRERSQIPIHIVGDSVFNVVSDSSVKMQLDELLRARDQYYMTSLDRLGGNSFTQHAARFALTPRYYDQTQIWYDLGLLVDGTNVAAITDMRGRLSHNRWCVVESNPQFALGTTERDDWIVEDAAIQAYCGDRYVPMLAGLQAAGDGGANDNADIADGLIPRSLRTDATHFNTAGEVVAARIIYDFLVDKGWLAYTVKISITNSTLTVGETTSAYVKNNGTSLVTISGNEADINTELASLEISGASAGTETLTTTLINPLNGLLITKTAPITITA